MKNYLHNSCRVVVLISLSILYQLNANEVINFRHLTVEDDGLSESSIYNIFQDSRGYMWISTDNGLNKYDGYTMESYQYMHYEDLSISKGAPRYIFEDSDGHIWIATNAGLINKLNVETEEFMRVDPATIPNYKPETSFSDIKQLPDGRLICPMEGMYLVLMDKNGNNLENIRVVADSTYKDEFYDELERITKKDNRLANILAPGDNENSTQEFSLETDDSVFVILMGEYDLRNKNGRFDYGWIEDNNGVKIWSPWDKDTKEAQYAGGSTNNRITVDKIKLQAGSYKIKYISDIMHSAGSWKMSPPDHAEYWGIGVYGNISNTNIPKQKEIDDKTIRSYIRDIEINSDGTMWLSTGNGMSLFDINKGVLDRYKTKYARGLGSIILDPYNQNYLWCLGNDDKPGLCRFNRSTGMFKYYDIDPDKSDEFVFNPSGLEFMNENEIWLWAGGQGILRFNHETGSASRLVQDRDNGNALRDNRISFVYRDKAGAMWVSTSTMGISIYDPYYQKFGLIPYKQGLVKNALPNPNISNMGQHVNGSIIINSFPDYFLFDPVKKELVKNNFNLPENYRNDDFTTSGTIAHFTSWDEGSKTRVVTRYDLSDDKILKQWSYDKEKPDITVWGYPIEEVLYDSRGILWIGYVSGNSVSAKMKDSDIFLNIRTDLSIFDGPELELATFIQKILKSLHG